MKTAIQIIQAEIKSLRTSAKYAFALQLIAALRIAAYFTTLSAAANTQTIRYIAWVLVWDHVPRLFYGMVHSSQRSSAASALDAVKAHVDLQGFAEGIFTDEEKRSMQNTSVVVEVVLILATLITACVYVDPAYWLLAPVLASLCVIVLAAAHIKYIRVLSAARENYLKVFKN